MIKCQLWCAVVLSEIIIVCYIFAHLPFRSSRAIILFMARFNNRTEMCVAVSTSCNQTSRRLTITFRLITDTATLLSHYTMYFATCYVHHTIVF